MSITTSKGSQTNSGLGFGSVLTLIFITLKLLGYITWSWWWVLSPLWIGLLSVIFFLGFAVVVLYFKNRRK